MDVSMSKRKPYRWPIGIELTGINPKLQRCGYDLKCREENLVKAYLDNNGIGYHNCGFDDHCLEIPTKKLWSWSETVDQAKGIRKALLKFGYAPKGITTVCGGSHVHVGITNVKLQLAVYKDCIMRPYLPWVFGEPDEKGAMDVIINRKIDVLKAAEYVQFLRRNGVIYAYDDIGYINDHYVALFLLQYTSDNQRLPNDHGYLIDDLRQKNDMVEVSTSYNTVEFRFFEMAPSWDEQVLQLEFLFAYLNWVSDRFDRGDVTDVHYITPKELQQIPAREAADSFLELCDQINIDGANYKHLLKRNLYPRWSEGYKRL